MDETLRQLEDRVRRASGEIRALRRRRDELESELAESRARATAPSLADAAAGRAWQDERGRIVAALRETIGELRGD